MSLEIVGQIKKPSRNIAPTMRVNSENFQMRFGRLLMENLGLKKGSKIAFAYDNEAREAYLLINYTGEKAITLGKDGVFNSSYHTAKLKNVFGAPSSFNVEVAKTPTSKDGYTVYKLSLSVEPAIERLSEGKTEAKAEEEEENVEVANTSKSTKWE